MADIHTGEAVVEANNSSYRSDSARKTLMQSICVRHGVSVAELDTSLYWYGHHLQEYMKVYDKTISILEGRIAEAEKAGGKNTDRTIRESIDGDSVNIWPGTNYRRNSILNPSDFISFTFGSDRYWERGDRYTLSARPVNPHSPIYMTLVVSYNDGTSEYVTLNQGSEWSKHLTLVLDSTKTATNLFGSIHYKATKGEVSYLDSLSLVRTRGRNDNVKARSGQHIVHTR